MKIYYESKKKREKRKNKSIIFPNYKDAIEVFNSGTHLTTPTSLTISPDGTIGDIGFTTATSTIGSNITSGDASGSTGMSTGGGMGESYAMTERKFAPLPETITKLNRICRILNCDRDNLVQITLAEDTQNNPEDRDDVEFIADLSDDILVYKYNDDFVISEEFDDTMVLYFQTTTIAEDYLNTKEEELENTFKEGYNLKETDDSMNKHYINKLHEDDYYDYDGYAEDNYDFGPDDTDYEDDVWFDDYPELEDGEYYDYDEALTSRRHGRHLYEDADEPELKKIPSQKEQEEWRMLLALLDQEHAVVDYLENLATDKNLKLPKEAVDIITGMTSDCLNHIGKLQKFMNTEYANGQQIQKSAEMDEHYGRRRNYRTSRIGR